MEDKTAAPAWEKIFTGIRECLEDSVPSVTKIAEERLQDPYAVLISTMISLRTKDEVTSLASGRLLSKAPDPPSLAELDTRTIGELIYPAGFYRTKAENLKKTAGLICRDHGCRVPDELEQLLRFPGVGRKTANLVLNLGFGKDAICVDTHVHRIANRIGWVSTATPEQTEQALMKVLPHRYWIPINTLLVEYGKRICTPLSPRCSTCCIPNFCARREVTRSR
ncbi:MAG: endonuclease III [Spirochaetales bacterium]|nr:endonuclease III [Spirochaetales bacterium]MCF7937362.1 endonuclease III [Spirochaetales bacterium]